MPTAPESRLTILQLNIGSLLEPGWSERRHEIVAWLDELRPDVACFEEVWESGTQENTAAWIADHSKHDWHWQFGGFGFSEELSPDRTIRFGAAVLSRWPIDTHNLFRLPVVEDGGFATHIGWELFHAETAGLDIFATHLAPAPTDIHHRRLQVSAIDEHVRAVRGEKDKLERFTAPRTAMPAILCGDFNAEPDSDEIRFLSSATMLAGRSAYWQDAWRVAGEDGPGYTQDWRWNPTAADLNVHRKRIDYVFVGDPFQRAGGAGRVLNCKVVCDTSLTGVHASDHAGVLAEVLWPERPE